MMSSGAAAEDAALEYLQARGLRLVQRNYRCRYGEIDLIMRDRETLVFVEVRLRNNTSFGDAADSITQGKRRRIVAAAGLFLARVKPLPPCRFDVVSLSRDAEPNWITDAFTE